MNAFVVVDGILFQPVLNWLNASARTSDTNSARFAHVSTSHGIHVYKADGVEVVLVNPKNFSLARLSLAIRNCLDSTSEINVIAPSAIQYFGTDIKPEQDIYKAINRLSKFAVSIVNTAMFKLHDDLYSPLLKELPVAKGYLHTFSHASFPEDIEKLECMYIDGSGELLGEPAIGISPNVTSVGVPMVIYHSGLIRQGFERKHLVESADSSEDKPTAYDELMIRFPSRSAKHSEIEALASKLNLTKENVSKIWEHNKAEWDVLCEQMKHLGHPIPSPTTLDKDPVAFNQFTHIVFSGFSKLTAALDVSIPVVRHIGMPLFARNGVTIALGDNGIVTSSAEFPAGEQIIDHRVEAILPGILNANLPSVQPTSPVVRAA